MSRSDWKLALSVYMNAMNDESLEALAQAGIFELELCGPRTMNLFNYPARNKELSRLAASHGITISSLHLPFVDAHPAVRDADLRKTFVEVQSALMRSAAEAGVSIAVLHPSAEPYKEEDREARLSLAIETVGQLTDAATACGITLALENLPRTCLCRTSDEMRRFLDAIPALRACFDTNHNLIEDNLDYRRAIGDRLVTLHVSDYDRIDEKHWMPMQGVNDWRAIIETLESIGYRGRFLYETVEKNPRLIRENFDALMAL